MVATEAPSAPSDADGCGAAPPDASERAHHVRPAAAAPARWWSGGSISSAFDTAPQPHQIGTCSRRHLVLVGHCHELIVGRGTAISGNLVTELDARKPIVSYVVIGS